MDLIRKAIQRKNSAIGENIIKSEFSGGVWRTINGAKVYIKGGKIVAGAEGKIDGGSGIPKTSYKNNVDQKRKDALKEKIQGLKVDTAVIYTDNKGKERSGVIKENNGKKQILTHPNVRGDRSTIDPHDWGKVETYKEANERQERSNKVAPEGYTEKKANPDQFKKPGYQRTKAYKTQSESNKKQIDLVGELSKLSLSGKDKEFVDDLLVDFDLSIPSYSNPKEYARTSDIEQIKEDNSWLKKVGLGKKKLSEDIDLNDLRNIMLHSEAALGFDYFDIDDSTEKKLKDIVDRNKVRVSPNQLRMFKSIISGKIQYAF